MVLWKGVNIMEWTGMNPNRYTLNSPKTLLNSCNVDVYFKLSVISICWM